MLGQSSFRRILLLRILLLSIPILFLGTGVTFRKARLSLLDTARQNLEQSAVKKAEAIQDALQALGMSLAIAGETKPLQFGSPAASRTLLTQLQATLPNVRCLQLKDLRNNQLIASTCGNLPIEPAPSPSWPAQINRADASHLQLRTIASDPSKQQAQDDDDTSRLNLALSTPIYDPKGKLRYSLTAEMTIEQKAGDRPWLQGYTVVVAPDGTFLAHPDATWVGRNIIEQIGSDRFQDILNNVKRGEDNSRQLVGFSRDHAEWLAGFSSVAVPLTPNVQQTWIVLATTRVESALQGLEEIRRILLILTAGMLAAHLLVMLYMARDLALPIEQLGKYALRIHKRNTLERAPKNFRIRELNHLAEVLDNMVGRLEERAKELESAWQEAEAANQLKSEFLANTSHELRTPLNAIIGCIRLVKDGCCDSQEEEVEFLEQADKAAIHLLKIINDLLDIQRIEEEKLPLSIETVDLQQIIKDVVALEAVQIQQKGLKLGVKGIVEPILIRADPARLKQVLLNIIYNAIKFTDQGGITLETSLKTIYDPFAHTVEPNGQHPEAEDFPSRAWVIIAVKDTGIGIDPAQQHKLFRPFVMVDGTTTRKFEGTGLGLAISRNLIEMMNGRITLHSAGMNQGTTVKIALPMVESPVHGAIAPEVKTTAESSIVG